MQRNNNRFSRRTILRGVLYGSAVQVGLPLFEEMLNGHGDALADGTPIPRKFGVWYFGDGVRNEFWTPKARGANWDVTEELAPIVNAAPGIKEYVSVISGMDAKGDPYVHAGPASAALTGTGLDHPGGDNGTPQGPSIDVLVAKEIGSGTPFATVQSGLYNFLANGSAYHAISHNGPDAPNYPELDARKIYNRLFGAGSPGERLAGNATTPVADNTVALRKSALDAVLADCNRLKSQVSSASKQRIEQHCESIRKIESRLVSLPASVVACTKPMSPTNITDAKAGQGLYGSSKDYKEVNETMSLLLAHALVCDLTRVFTHCYTNPAAHWIYDKSLVGGGVPGSFHELTHTEGGTQPNVHKGVVLQMGHLGNTVKVFKSTPLGTGNLLDYMAMMVTSDCSRGQNHDPKDMPFLVIGKAGGALKGNVHYRGTGESVTKATFTAAKAAAPQLAAFGQGGQRVTDVLTDVMA
ncbi:MAG: DUF1552 domain-containing protein [Deltaproteobacteria bacterium]|nr:DUF1552 domain-containing protein [Deltaproteobacteria bacterium]